jgi:NAD(P)-dependent dehydrogenase (short-subunit alcohol dehydrogenase family)
MSAFPFLFTIFIVPSLAIIIYLLLSKYYQQVYLPPNSNNVAVLVTGCSSGIGLYTAKSLAENGVLVYASIRNQSEYIQYDLSHPNIIPLVLDVTKVETIKNATEIVRIDLIKRNKILGAIVNNAGNIW